MTDIVERLAEKVPSLGFEDHDPTYYDRMDAIKEIKRLRAALREIGVAALNGSLNTVELIVIAALGEEGKG